MLTEDGIAGVKIGDTVNQASDKTGQEITEAHSTGDLPQECSATIAGIDGLTLYLESGNRIRAIEVNTASFNTAAGIHVGSTDADVKKAYPTATPRQGSYPGYVIQSSPSAANELVIGTEAQKVTLIFAGEKGIDQIDEFCG